jgi:16S rRNA (cytidine1402-2'-O)-methyltransferase
LKLFQSAEVVFCEDTRVTKLLFKILSERFNDFIKTPISPQTYISLHSHNEMNVLETIDQEIFKKECLYVSDAGMAAISDPGSKLVLFCQKNDIPYDVLPGASAGVCAFAMSGFDVTQHLFYGFLPHKGTQRKKCLEEALFNGFVTIIYESPHRILKFFEEVSQIAADRQIFAVREMTKKFETRYKGDAQSIYNHVKTEITKGEWVIVVDAGERKNHQDMTFEEISLSHLSMKDKAKELAKTTGKSPKECYALLQKHYG